jgi:hypothetical protein
MSPNEHRTFPTLVQTLRNPERLNESLEAILVLQEPDFIPCPSTSKCIVVACVESKSLSCLVSAIERLESVGYLNEELMYVAIRTACRHRAWEMSFFLLKRAFEAEIIVDQETLNSVMHVLTQSGRIEESMEILSHVHQPALSSIPAADIATYSMAIACAGRAQKRLVMMKTFQMLSDNVNVKADERTFLVALNTCSFSGDYVSATKIFSIYEDTFSLAHTRAYSLLIESFITFSRRSKAGPSYTMKNLFLDSVEERREAESKIFAIVKHLYRSNLDSSSSLANIILQYYCAVGDLVLADAYFLRMTLQLAHRPSALTMKDFSILIYRKKDTLRANELQHFLRTNSYKSSSILDKVKKCASSHYKRED